MYVVNNLGFNEDANRFDNHYQTVDERVTEPVAFIGGWMVAYLCEHNEPVHFFREEQEDGTIVYFATAEDGRFLSALYLRELPFGSAV